MTITEALAVEHAALRAVFDQIERVWPSIRTADEAILLARVVEGLLRQHGAKEEELLYVSYDHVLEDRGQMHRMTQEHQEIDQSLLQVSQCTGVTQAKRFLLSALAKARDHFRFEELLVFPAIEQALQKATLEKLASGLSATQGSSRPTATPHA